MSNSNTESEDDHEVVFLVDHCDRTNSEECHCKGSELESEYSTQDESALQQKLKICMAHSLDDEEVKVLQTLRFFVKEK